MEIRRAIHTVRYLTLFRSHKRANYIRKHRIFGLIGRDVYLPFMVLPFRSEYIYIHNNVEIASGVKLVPHDAIHGVFSRESGDEFKEHIGKIEILDNVFIGANAIILGPCTIGLNVIVAAGAVVCGNISEGAVVGGVPAKKIGSYSELKANRKNLFNEGLNSYI